MKGPYQRGSAADANITRRWARAWKYAAQCARMDTQERDEWLEKAEARIAELEEEVLRFRGWKDIAEDTTATNNWMREESDRKQTQIAGLEKALRDGIECCSGCPECESIALKYRELLEKP